MSAQWTGRPGEFEGQPPERTRDDVRRAREAAAAARRATALIQWENTRQAVRRHLEADGARTGVE